MSSIETSEGYQALVETLSHGVVAGYDDLMGLGDCLNLLEKVAAENGPLSEDRQSMLKGIEQTINRLILDESEDADGDWQSVQKRITELIAHPKPGAATEEIVESSGENPASALSASEETDEANVVQQPATELLDEGVDTGDTAGDEPFDPELMADFIEEARENLSAIELNILTLETDPDDKEALNAVFRPFHSLKGVSGFLNLTDIHHLSHQVENLLDGARSDELPVTDQLIDVVLRATDILKELLDRIEDDPESADLVRGGSPNVAEFLEEIRRFDGSGATVPTAAEPPDQSTAVAEAEAGLKEDSSASAAPDAEVASDFGTAEETIDLELLNDFIEEARENLSSIELNILSLETDPGDKEALNAVFRPFHSIKGVSGFLNLEQIHHLSHQVENLLDAARNGTLEVTDRLIDVVLKATDILKDLLSALEDAPDPAQEAGASSPVVASFLQQIEDFDKADPAEMLRGESKIGEILVAREVVPKQVIEEAVKQAREEKRRIGEVLVAKRAAQPQDVSQALRQQRHAKENVAYVRVATQKLDNLVDGVGELVIAQSMVLQNESLQAIKEQKLQKDVVQLSRITAELQRISMSLRMVPIKNTFQKLIRLVRDLAKKAGKEISLELHGEETEIDRNMVEEIYEPLVHMIRNAADHGIESPNERKQAGKPQCGVIRLAAEQSAGNIIIDIKDDGKGLNVEKIRQRAIERGIISEQDALSESAIFDLIFHPGFSTKEQVTEVSGRGVGMDVVRKTVEQLKGKVEISSTLGKGSHFQLKLPLTMAIIDGMVIKVGDQRYIVPTIALRESLRPNREDYHTVQGRGEMVKVRESLMPLIRLHKVFEVEPRHQNPWDGLLLVVTEGDRPFCLLADEIVGRQEVVIKGLGASMRRLVGISGGAILGDGRVALIIDVKGIVSLHEEKTL